MKIGISSASLYPEYTENAVKWLAKNKIEYIEIFFNSHTELDKKYVQELKSVLDFYDTKVLSVHPFTSGYEPFMFFTNYQRRLDDILEYYKLYFEAQNILDAPIFIFHGDYIKGKMSNKEYFDRFGILRELGKTFGVKVAQENVSRCKSGNIDFIKEMKDYFNSDIDFVFDIKQALRMNYDPFDMFDAMAENIVHIHLSDNNEKYDCLPPGKGIFDFEKLFNMLKIMDYNHGAVIELYKDNYDDKTDLIKGYNYLIDIKNVI